MEELDCLLICPPFVFPSGFYAGQRAIDPPLGMMALVSYLRRDEKSVRLIDCNLEFEDTDEEFEAFMESHILPRYAKIKVIGLNTTTPTINAAFRIAQVCKRLYPEAILILGGAHASFVPDESLDRDYIDCVCIGEGEETLTEVVSGKDFAEIDGLAYKVVKNGSCEFVKNKPRGRRVNLDDLPLPAYDLIDTSKYRPIIGNFKTLPAMILTTSRGCPWSCNFCRRPVGKMWSYRSPQSLYEEMRHLSEKYGIRDITFMDDVFTVSKKRVFELCELLIQNPLNVRWNCFARVDIVSAAMLKKMKQAGCWGIMYGVENFDQKVLDGINKGLDVSQIFDAVSWAKDAGLEIRICMMVGNPGDTEEIINANIRLVKKLNPDTISVAILTPFPGHGIYNEIRDKNLIMTYDWDLYFGSTPIVKLEHLSPDDIYRLFRKMTFSFYFRPSYILRRLWKIRSWTDLRYQFAGFLGLLGFFLDKLRPAKPPKKMTSMVKEKLARKINEEKIRMLTATPTNETATT